MTDVLVVRGHQANPWELRSWEELPEQFKVSYLLTDSNAYDADSLGLPTVPVKALRDYFPKGAICDIAVSVAGDRYIGLKKHLAAVDIVHAVEFSYWFSAAVAELKPRFSYKLVQTVWETIPFLDTYRNRHARKYRHQVMAATDLYLAATERARNALLLEGIPAEKIEVCYPGVDIERFRSAAQGSVRSERHVVISPGRLQWEKGHQDVLRAVAAIKQGVVTLSDGSPAPVPLLRIVGKGPEEERLSSYAAELGIGELVSFTAVPYEKMPALFAQASCMVLASLPSAGCMLHLRDQPRCFWEEQFGMVLAEAMAADLPIVASTSGAIPEVVGESGRYFSSGDWMELARQLVLVPLSQPPGTRAQHPLEHVERYSIGAAASRLAGAYERVTGAQRTAVA